MKHLGVRVRGQGMEVGNEEAAVIVVLHSHEFTQSSIIVAQMKISGRTDSTEHHFLIFFHID